MTTTVTTTNVRNTILDSLLGAEEGLTLAALAEATGLPCAELRAALDGIESLVGSSLVRPVDANGELGKATRVFTVTEAGRLSREADLYVLAEQAPEATLRDATRETLRAAALSLGIANVLKKSTKDTLVALILAERAKLAVGTVCVKCGAEPVAVAGAICTVCEEAASPVVSDDEPSTRGPRKPRTERAPGDLRIRVRRPDVSLNLTPEESSAAETIIKGAPSQRAAQRDVAHWLVRNDPARFVDAEVLRTILRTHGVLNSANFTINAKKEGWTRVDAEGGALKGWTIPNHVVKVAAKAEPTVERARALELDPAEGGAK